MSSESAQPVTELLRAAQADEVFAVVFHPDGTRIASGGRDRAVRLWDVASGQEVAHLPGHTSYVWSLAFSPDGKTLVSGSGDASVRAYPERCHRAWHLGDSNHYRYRSVVRYYLGCGSLVRYYLRSRAWLTTVTGTDPLITATLTDGSGDTSAYSNGVTTS